VVRSLKENALEPILTLNHFTLPLWLAGQGGWLQSRAPDYFRRYVERVVRAFGENVKYWITVNEPMVYLYQSYIAGDWPPGEQSYDKAFEVLKQILRAHVLGFQVIKQHTPEAKVGIAHNMFWLTPCRALSPTDQLSRFLRNEITNFLVLRALVKGRANIPGLFRVRLPQAQTLDFIGLNYYRRDFVRGGGLLFPGVIGRLCDAEHHRATGKQNSLGWSIYPEGVGRFLRALSGFGLPIMITENGICTENDGERSEFILAHLRTVASAMAAGANVIGYLYWSLMDNFEWAEGYEPKFGLIGSDYETQARQVRDSAKHYGEICRSGRI